MRNPYRPVGLRGEMFRGSEAVAAGAITRTQLRGSAWTRLRHDVYIDSRIEPDHEVMCRAVALTLAEKIVFSGPSAAYLHGAKHAAKSDDEVHVTMSPAARLHRHRGLRLHQTDLIDSEMMLVNDLMCTTPLRTAWDVAALLPVRQAVAVVDSLLAKRLVFGPDLTTLAAVRAGQRGSQLAARIFSLADAGAQSPPESHLRVALIEAGIPRPVTQHPIHAAGLTLHPDLAIPQYRVAIEYDGAWHADAEQLHLDRARLNRLVNPAGWSCISPAVASSATSMASSSSSAPHSAAAAGPNDPAIPIATPQELLV